MMTGREVPRRYFLALDESIVRNTVADTLRAQGYQVLEAVNGDEALQLIYKVKVGIDIVLTDMLMPSIGGLVLVERIRDILPEEQCGSHMAIQICLASTRMRYLGAAIFCRNRIRRTLW